MTMVMQFYLINAIDKVIAESYEDQNEFKICDGM